MHEIRRQDRWHGFRRQGKWLQTYLASLGSHHLSASVLSSLSQLVSLLIAQLSMWAGLGEQRQDGDSSMATNDWHIHVCHVQALLLCVEGLGPDLHRAAHPEPLTS